MRDVTLEEFASHEGDLPPVIARRCRFVVEENARVLDLAVALPKGDRDAISGLTSLSYRGARDLYGICSPEMEAMVDAMESAPGVIGARQAGAGFGGCMVALVDASGVRRFARHVGAAYQRMTGITPDVYVTAPSPGACVMAPLAPVDAVERARALAGQGQTSRLPAAAGTGC